MHFNFFLVVFATLGTSGEPFFSPFLLRRSGCGTSSSCAAKSKGKKGAQKYTVPVPEFSRVLNAGQIPSNRPVMCRLLAKEKERAGLALRLGVPNITYFSANITSHRSGPGSIIIAGKLEAHVKGGEFYSEEVTGSFETQVLDNTGWDAGSRVSLADAQDYDEEVSPDGDIDIGEIASQYLSLEMF